MKCRTCQGRGEVTGHPEEPNYDDRTGLIPCHVCEGTGTVGEPERQNPLFRVVTQVYRTPVGTDEEELVASVGNTVERATFVEAFPVITETIQKQLGRVAEHAALVDQG